jgi:SAM-dependent methyltransferase
MDISASSGQRVLASRSVDLAGLAGDTLELTAEIAEPVAGCEIRLFSDATVTVNVAALEIDCVAAAPAARLDADRPVGFESRKTYADKIRSGFFDKYLSGPAILEVGYKGYIGGTLPIVPQAIGIDLDYPGYDGIRLPFADESVDAVYSSHCFEHIADYQAALRDWYRVLKVGGYVVIVVPHQYLFEKRRTLPSPSNLDHKRYYTPESLLREIGESYGENTYRVRHLAENDHGFNYESLPEDPSHGCYEIELVVEKITKPYWNLHDNTVRAYSASEFSTHEARSGPWAIELDLRHSDSCLVWGPYVTLGAAEYEVEFYLDALSDGAINAGSSDGRITLDVTKNGEQIASTVLEGDAGREALRAGRQIVGFTNDEDGAYFEFRVSTGPAADRTLTFSGVLLRYARQPRV